MGLPSSGLESVYRNKIDEVAQFLDDKHKDHYLIVNLSETTYDYSKFHGQVIDFGFPDHYPPQLHMLFILCKGLKKWMDLDSQNVIAVHCKVSSPLLPILMNII